LKQCNIADLRCSAMRLTNTPETLIRAVPRDRVKVTLDK
jgi:hypothetical protein